MDWRCGSRGRALSSNPSSPKNFNVKKLLLKVINLAQPFWVLKMPQAKRSRKITREKAAYGGTLRLLLIFFVILGLELETSPVLFL
jgi:hypothetical protein